MKNVSYEYEGLIPIITSRRKKPTKELKNTKRLLINSN